jgi:acetyl-CoA carboxylase carboxyltransferase component
MILTLFVRAGVGRVSGQLCMIVANDATVKAGLSYLSSKLTLKMYIPPAFLHAYLDVIKRNNILNFRIPDQFF